MGLFKKYCPQCGGILERTGYSFPFPQWRCNNCIKRNKEMKLLERRIDELEKKLGER